LFWMKKMMKAYVGADYERGLDMLKAQVENDEVPSKLEFIGNKTFEGCKWIGIKTNCLIETVGPQMQADFGVLRSFASDNKELTEGQVMTIYHKWDIPNGKISYTAALHVKDFPEELHHPMIKGEIPQLDTYVLRHIGRYHHLGNAWSTLYNMLRNKELKTIRKVPPFELYLNNPENTEEKDLITDVYIPIKRH
ncbi:MAG: GyrI-like domain-containing protein, partial [Bacteroidota bacterium]